MESAEILSHASTVQSESLIELATLEDVLRSSCRIAEVRFVGVQSGFGLRPDMLLFPTSVRAMQGHDFVHPYR